MDCSQYTGTHRNTGHVPINHFSIVGLCHRAMPQIAGLCTAPQGHI